MREFPEGDVVPELVEGSLPKGWVETPLGKMGLLARGKSKYRPRWAPHLFDGDYPFIQTGEVKAAGKYVTTFEKTYSKEGLAQSKLWEKDTLCITIAANIAEISILRFPACFPDSVLGFIPDKERCNLDFVYYYFSIVQARLRQLAIGSVQDNINLGTFEKLPFLFPPLPEQKAIADMLSSFDEKIELLREQNKTLETLAQTIFKEWFVNFKAPQPPKGGANNSQPTKGEDGGKSPSGDLGAEMVDSELGEIPKGWRVGNIGDLFELHRGFDLPRKDRKEGAYPVYAAGGYHGQHADYKMEPPGIITGRSGVIGNVYLSLTKYWPLNTTLYVRNFKSGGPYYTYFFLKMFDLESLNSGSAVPSLNRNLVHNIPTLIADSKLLETFEGIAKETFTKMKFNDSQIQTLSKTRDTLLPKLMSGQVRVGEGSNYVS